MGLRTEDTDKLMRTYKFIAVTWLISSQFGDLQLEAHQRRLALATDSGSVGSGSSPVVVGEEESDLAFVSHIGHFPLAAPADGARPIIRDATCKLTY